MVISSGLRWLLAQKPSISSINSTFTPLSGGEAPTANPDDCSPFQYHGSGAFNLACEYVKNNSGTCEGGGYLTWTQWTICEENDATKSFIIISAVIMMFILFLFLSISADDFFCRNISAIVDHLKIPQHIAGVTFMAFGNGAPDVFTSLASALSTNQPKAGLSIGELLGAGIFVTSMVVATIIIAKPFKVMRRPILRDIFFYLLAIGWITFILFYDNEVYIWEPAVFLVLYACYVCTVIFGRQFAQSRKKKERQLRRMTRAITLLERKLTLIDKLEELKAEELHALEKKVGSMTSILTPNRTSVLSMANGTPIPIGTPKKSSFLHIQNVRRLSNPGRHVQMSIPNVHSVTTFSESPKINGWVGEKQLHPDEISFYVDPHRKESHKNIDLYKIEKLLGMEERKKSGKKFPMIRSKSDFDILNVKNRIAVLTNKVVSVTAVQSRRGTHSSIPNGNIIYPELYGPLRVQMAANMMLPNMLKNGEDNGFEHEQEQPIISHGKFFPKLDEEDDVDDEESDDSSLVYVHGGHEVISVHEVRSRGISIASISSPPPPSKDQSWEGIFFDLLQHLNPLDIDEYRSSNWFMKIYNVVKIPIYFILNLTIPVAECSWCKSLALIHCFTCPLTVLFAFMFINTMVIAGGPGLWAFALVFSTILAGLIWFFTTFTQEPKFYKPIAAYIGFVLSVAWIYVIANEVVDVVSMIGVMAGLSHELLGLTILAWANSIGDMVADFSVARQGFPRMAISAAIGGPLFNLMIGFGVSFFIAKLQGKTVTTRVEHPYKVDTVKKIMLVFLAGSLFTTVILLFIQKFNIRRFHSMVLIILYITFLVMVVLAQTHVLSF